MCSEFNKPICYMVLGNSSSIVSFDAQKPWENVDDYYNRVIDLLAMKRQTEHSNPQFMCRVFLGGLRKELLDDILEIDKSVPKFRQCLANARFLEHIATLNGLSGAGVEPPPPVLPQPPQPRGEPTIIQDGRSFYGEENERVNEMFKHSNDFEDLKILYRR